MVETVTRAVCIAIKEDRWYTTRTIGWKILDVDSDEVLAIGPFLLPLKEQVREKYGDVHFVYIS